MHQVDTLGFLRLRLKELRAEERRLSDALKAAENPNLNGQSFEGRIVERITRVVDMVALRAEHDLSKWERETTWRGLYTIKKDGEKR